MQKHEHDAYQVKRCVACDLPAEDGCYWCKSCINNMHDNIRKQCEWCDKPAVIFSDIVRCAGCADHLHQGVVKSITVLRKVKDEWRYKCMHNEHHGKRVKQLESDLNTCKKRMREMEQEIKRLDQTATDYKEAYLRTRDEADVTIMKASMYQGFDVYRRK